jgi:hypothetical protein
MTGNNSTMKNNFINNCRMGNDSGVMIDLPMNELDEMSEVRMQFNNYQRP